VKGLFVDTAGWMACADGADPAHRAACVATDYVIDETLTLIRKRLGLGAAEAWWEQVDGSSRLRWEWIGVTRAEKARRVFFRHRDKDYSFTDCTSLVVMQEVEAAAGSDHRPALSSDGLPSAAQSSDQVNAARAPTPTSHGGLSDSTCAR
jgi:predicted nucleic acid-binding protein